MFPTQGVSFSEHEVGVELQGRPRWWTVQIAETPFREVIRVSLQKWLDYNPTRLSPQGDAIGLIPQNVVLFVLVPVGAYSWPPLAASDLFLGDEGWEKIRELGGVIFPLETPPGQYLEKTLIG